jgi:hypothetical protein
VSNAAAGAAATAAASTVFATSVGTGNLTEELEIRKVKDTASDVFGETGTGWRQHNNGIRLPSVAASGTSKVLMLAAPDQFLFGPQCYFICVRCPAIMP